MKLNLFKRESARRRFWLLFSIFFNIGLMLVLRRLFDPVFEGSDDITIVQFVNGSCGSFDPHMVYQNHLMGLLLSNLYRTLPGTPWYSWMQYLALCASFTGICYVLCCRLHNGTGFFLSLLVQSFAAYECYINIQYTKTAGMLAAAGMLLLWNGLWGAPPEKEHTGSPMKEASPLIQDFEKSSHNPAALMWYSLPGRVLPGSVSAGILLSVWSILYRYAQFAACAALTAAIPFLMMMDCARTKEHRKKGQSVSAFRMLVRCLSAAALLAVLFAGLVQYDRAMYEQDPAWKNYVDYNNARSELMDYGMTKYEDFPDLYTELGISKTAYDLFDTWNSGDTKIFSTEVMKKLAEARETKSPGLETLRDFFKKVPIKFLKNRIFLCLVITAALWILFGRHDLRTLLALLAETLLFGTLYYYLFLKGRYLYNRVDAGLFMSVITVLLWTWKNRHRSKAANIFRAALILVLIAACVHKQSPDWNKKLASNCVESREHRKEIRTQMQSLTENRDYLYVSKLGILSASRCCHPFEPIPQGMLSNVVLLGGWKVESVPFNRILDQYGLPHNPYEAITGKGEAASNVLLLDEDIETTLAYIREYYNPLAQAQEAGEWSGKKLWRIVSAP